MEDDEEFTNFCTLKEGELEYQNNSTKQKGKKGDVLSLDESEIKKDFDGNLIDDESCAEEEDAHVNTTVATEALTIEPPIVTPEQRIVIDKTWKEFEDNLSQILSSLGSNKVEWTSFWGNMYRQVFTLKTLTRGVEYLREPLYYLFERFLVDHVQLQRKSIIEKEEAPDIFLRTYQRKWCDYAIAIKYMHDIFSMHYFWVKEQGVPDIFMYGLTVWRTHLYMEMKEYMGHAVVTLVNRYRDSYPVSDPALLPALIRNYVVLAPDSLNPLELFEDDFVKPFVASTRQYYTTESLTLIGDGGGSIPRFMQKAESRIEDELDRIKSYYTTSSETDQCGVFPDVYHALLHSCWSVCESMNNLEKSFLNALDFLLEKLRDILNEVLIASNQEILISSCPAMFTNGQWEDLSRMWRLLSRIDHTSLLEDRLLKHILDVGLSFVEKFESNKKKDVVEYVEGLHCFMVHYREGVKKWFANHKNFVSMLDKGFDLIVNKSRNGSRYIAQYTDKMMRVWAGLGSSSSLSSVNDARVDESLDRVIDLLNYLQDKDLFQAFYVHYLAKRLLEIESRNVDNDYEKLMIAKLKSNRGMSFTSKMERMFKDIALSQDIARDFSNWQKYVDVPGTVQPQMAELSPTVVTNGAWPNTVLGTNTIECLLPNEVEAAWASFRLYYLSKYSGRRLSFLPHLGTAEVKVRIAGKEYQATMPTFSMCILLLFNCSDTLSYADIKATTNIPDTALKSTLRSLTSPLTLPTPSTKKCSKNKKQNNSKTRTGPQLLLLNNPNLQNADSNNNNDDNNNNNKNVDKNNNNTEITEESVFNVNTNFSCSSKRFKVRVVMGERVAKEEQNNADTEEKLKKEREWQVDALIVRIMKSRRRLHHNALVQEVVSQSASRFVPPLSMIKTRIQNLIEREFIARCSDDMNTYVYIE